MSKPAVFVSYSHRDREWKDRLVHHLVNLERGVPLDLWEESRFASVNELDLMREEPYVDSEEIEEAAAQITVIRLQLAGA